MPSLDDYWKAPGSRRSVQSSRGAVGLLSSLVCSTGCGNRPDGAYLTFNGRCFLLWTTRSRWSLHSLRAKCRVNSLAEAFVSLLAYRRPRARSAPPQRKGHRGRSLPAGRVHFSPWWVAGWVGSALTRVCPVRARPRCWAWLETSVWAEDAPCRLWLS